MEIIEEDGGGWFVSVPDLPGCNSFGETLEEAVKNVQEAKVAWMTGQLESGAEIPAPTNDDDFSGKFILRIPRTLHRSMAYQAKKEGVSLNQYATHLLSERHALHVVQKMLDRTANLWREAAQNSWVHYGETENRKYVMMGTHYTGDLRAITFLSKPAMKRVLRVPETSEEQYNYAHQR